ncbi:MAG: hypothetical protein JSS34_06255 [Proteobacteria bacterium]|nr:hypothetical protein [Pseudomonadota bacterium]
MNEDVKHTYAMDAAMGKYPSVQEAYNAYVADPSYQEAAFKDFQVHIMQAKDAMKMKDLVSMKSTW